MFTLETIINIIIIGAVVDVIAIGTGLYMVRVIQPRYPEWWRRVIVDDIPM